MNDTASDIDYQVREIRAGIDRRIEALERVQSRQGVARWLGVVFGTVALLAVAIVGTRSADGYRLGSVAPTLEAGSFVIRDGDGVERASLGLRDDGGSNLTLADENGRARLRLSVLPDGSPGVTLLDPDGESRAILGLLPDGTTTLVFADVGSVARGVFALTPDGAARLLFSDADGQTRTAIGVDASGQPEINTIEVDDGRAGSDPEDEDEGR